MKKMPLAFFVSVVLFSGVWSNGDVSLAPGSAPSLDADGGQDAGMQAPMTKSGSGDFSVKLVSIHSHPVKAVKQHQVAVHKMKSRQGLIVASVASGVASGEASGKFTIQVSSFLTEGEAKEAMGKFQNLSDPWMSTAEVAGKTRYRIYSGHFKTMDEARAAQALAVRQSGVKEAFVQKVSTNLTAKNG